MAKVQPIAINYQKRQDCADSVEPQNAQDSDDGPPEYVVEAVVDDKMIGGIQFYYLKWEGYPSEENTWEPEEHLQCSRLIEDYKRKKCVHQLSKKYPKGFDLSELMPCPKQHRIRVVNTIDKAQLPSDLTYTDGYVRGPDVPYPSGVLFPCSCTGDKCGHNCECMEVMCYDEDGLLCLELKQSIHECNYLCKCSIDCPNRVVQCGANIHMEIFRTSYKGWGARALRPLRRGEYVCRYTGELITYDDSTLRDVDNTSTYLFDLDHEITLEDSNRFAIDAQKFGNISHFFNHSCEPNLVIRAAYINHLDQRLHELAFFACRDVKIGEELAFDYSPSIALTVPSSKDDHESNETYKKFRCYCDTPSCRKVMFA